MSAISEAFERLGFKPQERERKFKGEVEMERRAAAPDFGRMSADELSEAIRQLTEDVFVITEEMATDQAEGFSRGDAWRHRAGRARAYKVAHLKMAKEEEGRRQGVLSAGTHEQRRAAHVERLNAERALSEQRKAERQAAAEAAQAQQAAARAQLQVQQHALKAEIAAAWERREARRARMFLMAARRHLTKEELAWIWNAARDMFPAAPEWHDGPASGHQQGIAPFNAQKP